MTIPVPTFVAVEYWSAERAEWWVGHAGLNLMNPEKYVTGVTQKGKMIARAVEKDTGQIFWPKGYGADLL